MKWKIAALLLVVGGSVAGVVAGEGVSAQETYTERWDGRFTDNQTRFAPRLLAIQNRERQRLDLPALTWSAELENDARAYARVLARRGVLAHSAMASRPGQGENLWRGTSGAYALEEMIGHFIDERRDFRAGVFPKVTRRGRWEGVAHYTQIIWPTSQSVGCALARGKGADWLVCRYAPMGNVVGQRVG